MAHCNRQSMRQCYITVKSTNNFTIWVGPGKMKTVNGIARHSGNLNVGLTEQINNSLSDDLTICPRVTEGEVRA